MRAFVRGLCALTTCWLAIVAADGMTAAASAQTRTLTFKQLHTGETMTVTYKRNGRYDSDALKKINYILRDWRRNESTTMDPALIDLVWEVRSLVGSDAPVYVLSGFRSPVTNAALRSRSGGVAQYSQHMNGKALDFYIPGVPLQKLRETALKYQAGGVGYYPTSGSPFVHLDTGSVRHWPRMTRTQLAKLFPDGKTVHIPSDGKPMTGYNEAVAELQRGIKSQVAALSGSARRQQVAFSYPKLDPSMPVPSSSVGGSRGTVAALFESGEDGDETAATTRGGEAVAAPARQAPAQQAPAAPVPAAPAASEPAQAEAPVLVAAVATAPAPLPRVRPAGAIPPPVTIAAAQDVPVPSLKPVVVAALEPASATEAQPALAMSEAPAPGEKPFFTASVPPVVLAALPRERPMPAASPDLIAALLSGDEAAEDAFTPKPGAATALASTAPLADLPPFSATFTGMSESLRDPPAMIAIDYRPEALTPYLASGTCLRDAGFVALRHPDQSDIGALAGLAGPVVVNRFSKGAQIVYPMRRFSGPAVVPVATRTFAVTAALAPDVPKSFARASDLRDVTLH